MDVNDLLARLEKVRASGPMKWSACCPAHGDKTPSLAIREMADGRILLHCFSGCSASDIVSSLGFELKDLMPPPDNQTFFKPVRRPWSDGDALKLLARESAIVALATSALAEGKTLAPSTVDRVALAAGNIADAVEAHYGNH
jgi:hypothetical protein